MRYRYNTDAITAGMLHNLSARQREPYFPETRIRPLQRDTYLLGNGDVQLVTGQNIVARTRGLVPGGPRVVSGSLPIRSHLRAPIWNPFLWGR